MIEEFSENTDSGRVVYSLDSFYVGFKRGKKAERVDSIMSKYLEGLNDFKINDKWIKDTLVQQLKCLVLG